MDERWVLLDSDTGLHVAWYFWLRVLDEANRAARYGAPFGLLLLQADTRRGSADRLLAEAAGGVPPLIRSTDLGGTLGAGRAAVLLTHQDVEAAGKATVRIVSALAASVPQGVAWRERLLCYPADAAEISQLLTNGWTDDAFPIERRQSVEQSA